MLNARIKPKSSFVNFASLLLSCLALAACGGDSGDDDAESGIYDDSKSATQDTQQAPPAGGDDPRALARDVAVALEACYTETQDYSKCDTAEALDQPGLRLADPAAAEPRPGEVQIPEAGSDEYTVKTAAADGTLFTLAGSLGTTSRLCSPAGRSGCGDDGSW